jgi:hypothetical protein
VIRENQEVVEDWFYVADMYASSRWSKYPVFQYIWDPSLTGSVWKPVMGVTPSSLLDSSLGTIKFQNASTSLGVSEQLFTPRGSQSLGTYANSANFLPEWDAKEEPIWMFLVDSLTKSDGREYTAGFQRSTLWTFESMDYSSVHKSSFKTSFPVMSSLVDSVVGVGETILYQVNFKLR